jgi:hypothetical protein
MEVKELMAGVFVYFNCFDGSKIIVRVTDFKDGIVYGNSENGSHWCNIENVEPIQLTPETLEKNGFKEYDELYRLDIAEGVFVNADFKSKEPFVSIHNTCYRATPICKYLHQLQKALRLCGIEKEIIL